MNISIINHEIKWINKNEKNYWTFGYYYFNKIKNINKKNNSFLFDSNKKWIYPKVSKSYY